ncbi:unnamed protein product [Cylicocyclus nassatus]|uniref:Uncharacterized protein n=1 Tax=Cylicocyclus nassatus TaxID=53992 RepID=A0AA36DS69_CYLNA|nr:unnamed protein product [Cylicocyclus nassatus]
MGLDMYLYRMNKSQKSRLDEIDKEFENHNEKWTEFYNNIPTLDNGWEPDESKMTDEQKRLEKESRDEYRTINDKYSEISKEIREAYGDADNEYGYETIYWRKFNALHGYIVEKFANGVDECQDIHLTVDDLKTILKALEDTKRILDGCKKEKNERDEEVFIVPKTTKIPLRPRSGFFFGSMNLDEWFYTDVKTTIKSFRKLIDNFNPENEALKRKECGMQNWKMTLQERKNIRDTIADNLFGVMSDDYVERVADAMLDKVVEDVEACADREWNYDDVRLAVGRVLCDSFGVEH